ncbi:MAG: hypothetical protein ACRDJU_04150 [Actinomycetota bacterium]
MPASDSRPKYLFPFGEPVRSVGQTDRSSKPVFVLGAYLDAVHAEWRRDDGTMAIRDLPVASEPAISWGGDLDEAGAIIGRIQLPMGLGTLTPASEFNGASGRALDDYFLAPLGIDRSHTWVCDLLPESRTTPAQAAAIEREYTPLVRASAGRLPPATIPVVSRPFVRDDGRRAAILDELVASGARTLVTLGDVPLAEFVHPFGGGPSLLSSYVETPRDYGQTRHIKLRGRPFELIPLVHPRRAAQLDRSPSGWNSLHRAWVDRSPSGIGVHAA